MHSPRRLYKLPVIQRTREVHGDVEDMVMEDVEGNSVYNTTDTEMGTMGTRTDTL